MKRVYCSLLAGILSISSAVAQELPSRAQQQLEAVAEGLEDTPEDDQWLQQLEYYRRHPLAINSATEDDLRSLRLLTDLQIYKLLQYRQHLGQLIDVYELQAVPGWDTALIRRLAPFIRVAEEHSMPGTLKKRLKSGAHTLLLSDARMMEPQKGYRSLTASRYLGTQDHVQFRYQYRYKNLLRMGVTGDKDAGEPFGTGAQRNGFDFYSFHLFARKLGVIKALALGDFTVNLGQGLVQWQSLAFGKSAEVINIKHQSPVLQSYSSAGEYYFNRGAGLTLQKGRAEATAFASYRKLSGNRVKDTVNGEEFITSIQSSGYHRTTAENEDRNHVGLTLFGGSVALKYPHFSAGVNAVHNQLSKSLQKREEPYNLYAIRGKEWSNYSVDYSATFRNMHLYGEAAVDQRFYKAMVQGLLVSVDAKADVSLLYRSIEAGYQSFSGKAFTENTMPTNEQGLYMGVSIRPKPSYRIEAYGDFYRFPWLKYGVEAPSTGRDYSVQLTWQPHKNLEIYARYHNDQKADSEPSADSVFDIPVYTTRHNCRLHLNYELSKALEIRGRTEVVIFEPGGRYQEKGLSAYAEGVYRKDSKFSCNLRLQYFATGGYNSRIYAYESDVLYHYYIPAFYNQGLRYYVRINYDISKRFSFWFRWAQTIYKGMDIIGSGLDQIEGSQRSEVKLQGRLSL